MICETSEQQATLVCQCHTKVNIYSLKQRHCVTGLYLTKSPQTSKNPLRSKIDRICFPEVRYNKVGQGLPQKID